MLLILGRTFKQIKHELQIVMLRKDKDSEYKLVFHFNDQF